MLPVTHGIPFTCLQMLLYTILSGVSTILPVLTGMSGLIYLAAALLLNARFLYYVTALNRDRGARPNLPMITFRFSITYLMWLYAALILDHYLLFAV
jgi:heme o synthase